MPNVSASVQELLALTGSAAALQEIAPTLGITSTLPARPALPATQPSEERRWFAKNGFGAARAATARSGCAPLVGAIEALRARALPATFVYAYDDAWMIGEAVQLRISHLLGHAYELIDDVWAWHIPHGRGGWPPHRGVSDTTLDRDAPEIVNAWIALSDVTADRACMHAIPLDEDPGYPGDLEQVEVPLSSIRAMPASAGDALFWNANVLHWGGRCDERAAGPRVSCSFTLRRSDAARRFRDFRILSPRPQLDLPMRMDTIARMILAYGKDQEDVSEVVGEWASLTVALASRRRPK